MRKIIASEFTSIDGYMVGKDEDMSWVTDNFDNELGKEMSSHIGSLGGIILGRVTYEIMSAYWPNAIPEGNYDEVKPAEGTEDPVITERMNNLPKVVFSRTLENAPWGKYNNVTLYKEIDKEKLLKLKMAEGNDIEVQGSASIVQSLINLNILDELRLIIPPVIIGEGKLLFRNIEKRKQLILIEKKEFRSGVVILKYQLGK